MCNRFQGSSICLQISYNETTFSYRQQQKAKRRYKFRDETHSGEYSAVEKQREGEDGKTQEIEMKSQLMRESSGLDDSVRDKQDIDEMEEEEKEEEKKEGLEEEGDNYFQDLTSICKYTKPHTF